MGKNSEQRLNTPDGLYITQKDADNFSVCTLMGSCLTEDDVNEWLGDLFATMVELASDIDEDQLNMKTVYHDIAGRLFDFAAIRWIDDESPEGDTQLGSYMVTKQYREEFIDRINHIVGHILPQIIDIDDYRATVPKWKEETPTMIVANFTVEQEWADKKFKLLKAWFKFAGKLNDKVYAARLETHPELSAENQFLARHIFRARFKSVVTDHHVSLATFIRSISKKYAALEPIELTWRPL